MTMNEKEKIIRFQVETAIIHDLNVPPVDQWEHDENRNFIESTVEEQNEIMAEKIRRAAVLRRKIGDTNGLIVWFVANLRVHNPVIVDIVSRYNCCWNEVLPDKNTFKFMATLNCIRNREGGCIRRSSRLENRNKIEKKRRRV